MMTRYAVEAKVGQEVENWIFSISKEATGAAADHQMDADHYDADESSVMMLVLVLMLMMR